MKILTANIAFGLRDMDKLVTNISNHFAVHGWGILTYPFIPQLRGKTNVISEWKRTSYIQKRRNLEPILSLVSRVQPDVLIVNEVVYELYKSTFEDTLRDLGFKTFSWGAGQHYHGTHFSTLVVTKKSGTPIACVLPQRRVLGGGAGMAGIRLEGEKLSIIGLHLTLGMPQLWKRQVQAAADVAQAEHALGNAVILAGDWNDGEAAIIREESFQKLHLISADSARTLTCPTFFRPMMKDLDHIFIPKAWKRKQLETFAFGSDHLAVAATVERA